MTSFVVYRDTWLRGPETQATAGGFLLDRHGRQCCLGFVCEQLGASPDQLMGIGMPSRVPPGSAMMMDLVPLVTEWPIEGDPISDWEDSPLSIAAQHINDDGAIGDVAREERLVVLFREYGLDLRFEDTQPEGGAS